MASPASTCPACRADAPDAKVVARCLACGRPLPPPPREGPPASRRPLEVRLRDASSRAEAVEPPTAEEVVELRRLVVQRALYSFVPIALLTVIAGSALLVFVAEVELFPFETPLGLALALGALVLACAILVALGVARRMRPLSFPPERRLGKVLGVDFHIEPPLLLPRGKYPRITDWLDEDSGDDRGRRLRPAYGKHTLALLTEDGREVSFECARASMDHIVEGDVVVAFTRGSLVVAARKLPV